MKATELKSIVFAKLVSRGLAVNLNHIVRLSHVRGYQRVTLDIVALGKDQKPFIAIYVGPHKERKAIKYKLTKVRYLELADDTSMDEVLQKFIQIYIDHLY